MHHGLLRNVRVPRATAIILGLLIPALILSGCIDALFGAAVAPTPAHVAVNHTNASAPTLQVSPDSGSGGLYVQVSGAHWPQNMLVLVTLKDNRGVSDALAASNTDPTGNLTTGFIYPIDARWLDEGSYTVVATTADGLVAAKTDYLVLPPGVVPPRATETVAESSPAADPRPATDSMLTHKVSLPAIVLARAPTANPANAQRVQIALARPGAIQCGDDNAIVTIAILTTTDFDATSVDPSTVTVASGLLSKANLRPALPGDDNQVEPARRGPRNPRRDPEPRPKPTPPQPTPQPENNHYEWSWYLEDTNGDGQTDLVMQFRLGYTHLPCDAPTVTLTGRTTDGRAFEGRSDLALAAQRGN